MRKWFVLFGNLLGLFLLYRAVGSVVGFGTYLVAWVGPGGFPADGGFAMWLVLVTAFLTAAISLWLVWLLLKRTDWIADRLGIQTEGAAVA